MEIVCIVSTFSVFSTFPLIILDFKFMLHSVFMFSDTNDFTFKFAQSKEYCSDWYVLF